MRLKTLTTLVMLGALLAVPQAHASKPKKTYNFVSRIKAKPVVKKKRSSSFNFFSSNNKPKSSHPGYNGKETVSFSRKLKPGTILIKTKERRLYYVLKGGKAIKYGIGVGRQGFTWSGRKTIARKTEWPSWTPPAVMRARAKKKGHTLPARMEGGPRNPLGARAMYLSNSLYRIHGTNNPASIGHAVSSGCIRMLNEEVVELYKKVRVGTRVIVE